MRQWATPREIEYLDAIEAHGGIRGAAKALGVHRKSIHDSMRRLERRAALQGYSPEHDMTKTVPEGFKVKGVSTYYDSDGKPRGQWVKSSADADAREEMMRAAVAAMSSEIVRAIPVPSPGHVITQLLTQYTFTDYHLGALCWHKEGGADWDVSIAEQTGVAAMTALVEGSPAANTAVVDIHGDFMHYDGLIPVTPTHGHVLDADSRFGRVVEVAIRLIRKLVALALEKHLRVILVIAEGNHDVSASLWLRKLFAALYEVEDRVTVHDSELPYYAIRWGNVMLGYHHGHLRKNDQLPILFAAQFSEIWGQTTKRYIHTGHRHHKEDKEHPGVRVIQHPTLAARDAFAARGGWISERAITAMTFHREYGEVGTVTVCPEMLS